MPMTPAGLPAQALWPYGREALSIAFLSTPGRERILSLRWGAAVQSFAREGPCLLGIFAGSQTGREYSARYNWRSEPVSN